MIPFPYSFFQGILSIFYSSQLGDRFYPLPPHDSIYTSLESIYQQTGDIHFRIPIFQWLDPTEAVTVIQSLVSLPEEEVKKVLQNVAREPSPLSRHMVIQQFAEIKGEKNMISFVKLCAREKNFIDDDFVKVVEEIANQPLQPVLFFIATVITIRPSTSKRLCDTFGTLMAHRSWDECNDKMWKILMGVIQKAKEDAAAILYQLPAERVSECWKWINCLVGLYDGTDQRECAVVHELCKYPRNS